MACTYLLLPIYVVKSPERQFWAVNRRFQAQLAKYYKNSSGDEIANVNFYAVHPGSYRNSLK